MRQSKREVLVSTRVHVLDPLSPFLETLVSIVHFYLGSILNLVTENGLWVQPCYNWCLLPLMAHATLDLRRSFLPPRHEAFWVVLSAGSVKFSLRWIKVPLHPSLVLSTLTLWNRTTKNKPSVRPDVRIQDLTNKWDKLINARVVRQDDDSGHSLVEMFIRDGMTASVWRQLDDERA